MIYIYGLIDPSVHKIAYIGKTNDLYARWGRHTKTDERHKAGEWIKRLRIAGVEPTVVVLEEMADDADWINAERWWIAHGLRMKWPLSNTAYASGHNGEKSLSEWMPIGGQSEPTDYQARAAAMIAANPDTRQVDLCRELKIVKSYANKLWHTYHPNGDLYQSADWVGKV
ncbi:MAG: hypothetical protein DDT21_01889 [Syntrophomonadaceae bacterium]|nr:hypothetical protein [Bacillota bacterium]